jgi:AcrR family transcriptional regulator
MSHEQTDPRVQRTEAILQEALIDLTAEIGFDAVTVGKIADRARVNRATFYRHYRDKYDLVEKIFQDAAHGLAKDLGPPGIPIFSTIDPQNPPERWVGFFEHFLAQERLYRALLGRNGSPWFAARLRDQLVDFVEERERLRDQNLGIRRNAPRSGIPRKVAITLMANLLIGTITWWLESGRQYSPQQIAGWFLEAAIEGYVPMLGV